MCILTLNGGKDRSGLPAQPARSAAQAGHLEPCKQTSSMRSHVSAHMWPDSPALVRQPTPAGRAAPPWDGAHSYEIHGTQKRVPPKHRVLYRTVDDVADVIKVNSKEVGRAYRVMKRKLRIRTPPPSPMTYVARFCSELGLNMETENTTRNIIRMAENAELTYGKSPCGITAAALYIAGYQTGQIRTQREISEITNVTEVTIRNRYKGLLDHLNMDIDL